MKTLSFASFDYVDADISIGCNKIFYRGIDKDIRPDQVIRPDIPIFLGPKNIAKDYGNVYKIKTTTPLKLLDFRRLKNLMRLVVTTRKTSSSVHVHSKVMECVELITIAFGLCSYKFQIDLFEKYVNKISDYIQDEKQLAFVRERIVYMKGVDPRHMLNPFEPEGVRIAETSIDRKVMFILKELFGDLYDGYIAPKMYSPFHVGNASHEEILIFDPINSGLVVFTDNTVPISKESISTKLCKYNVIVLEDAHFKRQMFTGGGKCAKEQERNGMFDDKVLVKEAKKLAHFFVSKLNVSKSIRMDRHPDLAIDYMAMNKKREDEIGCV